MCLNMYNDLLSHTLIPNDLVNVRVGNACSSDLQCTGTDKAGVCSNGSCDCQMGYLHIYGMCVEGNKLYKIVKVLTCMAAFGKHNRVHKFTSDYKNKVLNITF